MAILGFNGSVEKHAVQGYIKTVLGTCFPVIREAEYLADGSIDLSTVVYIDISSTTGAVVYTPIAGDTFDLEGCKAQYDSRQYCHRVIVAGAWGAVGDILTQYQLISLPSGATTITFYNNNTLAVVPAPSATDVDDCDSNTNSFSVKLWDYLPTTQTPVEIIGTYTTVGGVMTRTLYNLDGTVYTAVGTIKESQDYTYNLGFTSLNLVANTSTALPVPPAGTTYATVMNVNGSNPMYFRTDGTAVINGATGNGKALVRNSEVELYNNDIAGFRIISGVAGRIAIEWRNHSHNMPQ